MLKGLSTVQCNGQAGKVLSQGAAATQGRVPVALNNGNKLSVKLANLKVEADVRLEDSMPPPENSMPSLEDDGDKTLGIQKQENPGVEGHTSTATSCLPQETEAGHLKTLARRSQNREHRHTAMQRARK